MHPTASRFATLMGSASFLTLTTAITAHAQQVAQAQMAQAGPEAVPEQVLITGSLIHGTAAVGVPVTNLGVQDFTQTGNITIGDLFRTVPQANVAPGPSAVNSGGHQERETRVNIRGLDQTGPRTLLMVDGVRFPPQADGLCAIDPSIIPALALDRVDILADGASATYGSDAIAGVVNVILKRGFDGAVTLLHAQMPTDGGGLQVQASQLFGRTWQGGDVTLTYEWTNEDKVKGTVHSNYTANFTPWGLDNRIPIGASMPGTVSTGSPVVNNGQGVKGVGTNCANCFSVPAGTGANFSAGASGVGPTAPGSAGPTWATLLAHPGVTNQIDPLKQGWEEGAQQKNSLVGTFDQQIFPGVTFFFTGFYTNRRVEELLPPVYSQSVNTTELETVSVPTINPYYPAGAPNNLQVAYDFAHELPATIPAYELSDRYSFGFNLDLPFGWSGQIYDSRSYETAQYTLHYINPAAVNIALGNPTSGSDALGNPVSNVTKPVSLPYLNLFCDPTAFQCNSPATLNYIGATRLLGQHYSIEEKGARFDGPLFDLPGGQVKVAVGGSDELDNVVTYAANNSGTVPNQGSVTQPILSTFVDSEPYDVWAVFTQVDIPVFGDNFNLPLIRKLDLEGSWRHDKYSGSLSGATSNPKVAFTWLIDETIGATVRGSWGTSFRFANAGEFSTIASDANSSWNFADNPSNSIPIPCTAGKPTPGSLAADLIAAGFKCGDTPGGDNWAGGPHPELRAFTTPGGTVMTREGGTSLAPETSNNYSIGIEFAPQFDFLRGLDIQATWYSVKVSGTLLGFNNLGSSNVGAVADRFHFIMPSDLGCPVAANANPTSCAPFQAMVKSVFLDRNSQLAPGDLSNVFWIDDGSTVGTGFQHVSGIDFNASYDLDLGDFGAWNTGITGTYYLHRFFQTSPAVPAVDLYHTDGQAVNGIQQPGVALGSTGSGGAPRLVYRGRLGWSNGAYSITGFVNYSSHYYQGWPVPPNVNLNCAASGGTVAGGTFPCAINNFTTSEPSFYTFDLSLGYNTGDLPANTYLKNMTIQLVIQNLMGIHSPFEYGPSTSTRNYAAYDVNRPNQGRVIGLTLVKNW